MCDSCSCLKRRRTPSLVLPVHVILSCESSTRIRFVSFYIYILHPQSPTITARIQVRHTCYIAQLTLSLQNQHLLSSGRWT